MQRTTDGIVLSDYKIDEDRILTILTRDCGVITAYANGANKLRGKLAASTELLCYSRFVLFSSKGRNVVDCADAERIFFGIRSDLQALSLASYFAQLTAELAPTGETADAYLSLLLNSLHFIETKKRDYRMLKALFELRLLTLAGYMPQLVACRECGCFTSEKMWFFPQHGEIVCAACVQKEDTYTASPVAAGVLAAMRHILYAPPDKLFSFQLSASGLDSLVNLSERYLKYQLEKTLPTLEFYNSITAFGD